MLSPVRRGHAALLLLALAATLVVSSTAQSITPLAGTGNTDCKKQPLTFIESVPVLWTTINSTVPPGREFVVTDLTVTNDGTSKLGPVRIRLADGFPVGELQSSYINVPHGETLHLRYTVGPRFAAGTQIVFLSSLANTNANVQVSGYEVDAGCDC
jgi:hypothetical protein